MKLHLPKGLFIAVLAATGAVTTAWGKGDIIKYTTGSTADFHKGNFYNETTGKNGRWELFCSDNGSYNGGDTLKLSGTGATLNYSFSPLSYNALIVEEGATGYVITPSAAGRPLKIGREGEAHTSTINESVSVSSGASSTTTISGTQTWLVKEGKQYTIDGGNVTNNSALTIGGGGYSGTVSFSGKTITGNGSILVSSGTLADAVFGSGTTLVISGVPQVSTYSNVTMSAGSNIDLSSATLSANTPLINTSHLSVADGVLVNLDTVKAGDTLALFDSAVDVSTFYINGVKLSEGRSAFTQDNGVFTFTSVGTILSDMVWAGGTTGTWNSTAETWQSASVDGKLAFADGDSVTFNSSATVDIAESVTVGGLTISGGTTEVKFTRSNNGYIAGNVEVTGGAKLIIGTETAGSGFVQGNINVTEGTLQFDAKDVTGYDGGAASTQKITIASGSSLYLNHEENETFVGTLVLNGTLSGKSGNSKWDFYGTNAKVQVDSGNHGSISAYTRVRGNLGVEVGGNASLTFAKVTKAAEGGGTGVLTKSGAGQLIFAGNTTAELAAIRSTGGSIKVGNSSTDTSSLTVSRIELGSNNSGSGDILYVGEGSLLKITGNTNQDTNRKSASIILGEWNVATTVNLDGTMLAKDAYVLPGITGGVININGTGTLAVAGISKNAGGAASKKIDVTLNDGGKLILGSGGIDASLESDSITLKNGTVATYADSMVIAKDVTLSGTTGTTFDTEKYAFAADGNSISKIAEATPASITVSGVISGEGKLIKDGQGVMVLSAQNTYTGGTTIKRGSIQVVTGAELGSGGVEVQQQGVLEIETYNNGNISIAGDVTLKDGGTMIIKNGYWSDKQSNADILVENSGRIESGWGGDHGYLGGTISGVGTLELACPVWKDTYSTNLWKLTATVSDKSASEKLAVSSNTNVTMEGDNSYSGGTVIQGYTLTTKHENALGSGKVSLEGGMLQMAADLSLSAMDLLAGSVDNGGHQLNVSGVLKVGAGQELAAPATGGVNVGTLELEKGASATMGSGLKMANLTLASGSSVTIHQTVQMGNPTPAETVMLGSSSETTSTGYTLSLEKGLTLKGDIVGDIKSLTPGSGEVVLFTGVDTLKLGDQTYNVGSQVLTSASGVKLTDYFSIEGINEYENYYLAFDGNGSVIAGLNVPEPTTATLGLLALAGLCARRRRK